MAKQNVGKVPHGYTRKEHWEISSGQVAGECEVIFQRAEAIGEVPNAWITVVR